VFIAEALIGSSSHPLNVITCCKFGVFNNQQLTRHSNGQKTVGFFARASHILANNFIAA